MPWAVWGSKEGYFDFTLSETKEEAAGKFNSMVVARRVLVHPLSELEVRLVDVLQPRSLDAQIAAALLRGERAGDVERLPGKPTVEYKPPSKAGGTCMDCGRPRSFGSGKRCRECYSARSAKNALWRKKGTPCP